MMKKKHFILAALAVVLVLSSSIGIALAYFTTYATARGGYVIHLGNQTELREDYENGQKTLQIKNTAEAGTRPVFVRAKALAGTDVTLTYADENHWYDGGDGYHYYTEAVYGQETTGQEVITITFPKQKDDTGKDIEPKDGTVVNVTVIYECVPAVFTAEGFPDRTTAWANGKVTVINGEGTNG